MTDQPKKPADIRKPTFCKKHPKYRAIRQPSVDCYDCRRFYYETNLIDLRGEFHK